MTESSNKREPSPPPVEIRPATKPVVDYATSVAQTILKDFTSNEDALIDRLEIEINKSKSGVKVVELPLPFTKGKESKGESCSVLTNDQSYPNIVEFASNLVLNVIDDALNKIGINSKTAEDSQSQSKPKTDQGPTPIVTFTGENRINSEPNLIISPINTEVDPCLVPYDTLGGYVILPDDSKIGMKPKSVLKGLIPSNVEIEEILQDTDSDSGSEQGSSRSHRIMSLDSTDSIITVRELELRNEDFDVIPIPTNIDIVNQIQIQTQGENQSTKIEGALNIEEYKDQGDLEFEPISESEMEAMYPFLRDFEPGVRLPKPENDQKPCEIEIELIPEPIPKKFVSPINLTSTLPSSSKDKITEPETNLVHDPNDFNMCVLSPSEGNDNQSLLPSAPKTNKIAGDEQDVLLTKPMKSEVTTSKKQESQSQSQSESQNNNGQNHFYYLSKLITNMGVFLCVSFLLSL